WVEIVQADDKSNRDTSFGHVVDESAAEFFIPQRPAHRVNDTTSCALFFGNFPHLLDANSIDLRISVFVEVEFLDQLFRERTACPFGQYRDLGANVDAGFEITFGLAVLIDALVARSDTDESVAFNEKIRTRKSGKNVDADLFNPLAEPPCESV